MKIDFHCHSRFSYDSLTSPRELERAMARSGCDRIAVADHDAFGFHCVIRSPVFIRAQEIKTEYGDIIGLFLEREVRARTADAVLAEIRHNGGIAVLPHPFRYGGRLRMHESLLDRFDLIEVMNGRCSAQQNWMAVELAAHLGIPFIAGSDAHRASEVGRVTMSVRGACGWDDGELRAALLARKVGIHGESTGELGRLFNRVSGIYTRRMRRWVGPFS